jgi:hypothetical protein
MIVLKRENPYTPGAGRKPPILAGRDGDLENFQSMVDRLAAGGYERSLIYSGLRQLGDQFFNVGLATYHLLTCKRLLCGEQGCAMCSRHRAIMPYI